jgi:tetratricopeptide (TPR) repeat protein
MDTIERNVSRVLSSRTSAIQVSKKPLMKCWPLWYMHPETANVNGIIGKEEGIRTMGMIKPASVALLVSITLLLSACAGLGIYPSARHEFKKGMVLFDRGAYEDAAVRFQKATKMDPDYARAYLYLGRCYLNLGRWYDALIPLRTALRLAPEDVRRETFDILFDALLNAMVSELKKGDIPGFRKYMDEIRGLSDTSDGCGDCLTDTLLRVGGTLLAEGRAGDAMTAYVEVLKLSPRELDAHLGLVRAFIQRGDFHEAMKAAREALYVAPDNSELQVLLRGLMGQQR